MPHVKARIRKVQTDGGKLMAAVEFNEKMPKVGELVTVKWGSVRSVAQNRLYWLFLSWCIEHGGLKEHGHFAPEALHQDLKAYFLAEKIMSKGEFKAIENTDDLTTTDLGKAEFGEYMEKVKGFMKDFFNIDSETFWAEYGNNSL